MRLVHWLFLISAALFISGVGFVIASARTTQRAPDTTSSVQAQNTTAVASVKQIMRGIVGPAAATVFGSVATVVTAKGRDEKAPKTDQQWEAVGNAAAALVESGNLLVIGNRAVDADWIKISRSLMDAGTVALQAVGAKNAEALLDSGEAINAACDTCHQKYQR